MLHATITINWKHWKQNFNKSSVNDIYKKQKVKCYGILK